MPTWSAIAGLQDKTKSARGGVCKMYCEHRAAQVKPHAGRIVRIKGDGILVEFPSAVEAVASAVALQQAMAREECQCHRMGSALNCVSALTLGTSDD